MNGKLKLNWSSIAIVVVTAHLMSAGLGSQAAELHIGGASVSITPDGPVALSGQMHTRIARTVESEVTATVMAILPKTPRRSDRKIRGQKD